MGSKLQIGVLVSGGGSNLQAIIDACQEGRIDGKVVFVGADNHRAGGLDRAKKHGIPTFSVDYAEIIRTYRTDPQQVKTPADFDLQAIHFKLDAPWRQMPEEKMVEFLKTRAIAEGRLLKHMRAFPFDLLVLAGFMRSLTPYFIDEINPSPNEPRIMNIHPALLPAFPGVDGYGDTFGYGCKVGGCTVHFIDYGEDSGPIIGQSTFDIEETDDLEAIREKGLQREWELYPRCIQYMAQGRLRIEIRESVGPKGRRSHRTVVRILPQGGTAGQSGRDEAS